MRTSPPALLLGLLLSSPAPAATFLVTDAGRAPDAAPGDGACAASDGRCSLTAAFEEANALPGEDEVVLSDRFDAAWPDAAVTDDLVVRDGRLAGTGHVEIEARLAVLRVTSAPTQIRSAHVRAGSSVLVEDGSWSGTFRIDQAAEATLRSVSWDTPYNRTTVVGGTLRLQGVVARSGMPDVLLPPLVHVQGGELHAEGCCFTARSRTALLVESGLAELDGVTFDDDAPVLAASSGPSIEVLGGSLTALNCRVLGGRGGPHGGLVVAEGASATLSGCVVDGVQGDGIRSAGTLVASDCRILGCNADGEFRYTFDTATGLVVTGGTARLQRTTVAGHRSTTLHRTRFSPESWGTDFGGGVRVDAGELVMTDGVVAGNAATGPDGAFGAGLAVGASGRARLERCRVTGNSLPGDGAGIWSAGDVTLVNVLVAGNVATAAVDVNDPDLPEDDVTYGGAGAQILVASGTLTAWSCTVAGAAPLGVSVTGGTLRLADSILSGCAGSVESLGHVLVESPAGCAASGDLATLLTGPADLGADFTPGPGSLARDAAHPGGSRDGGGGVLLLDAALRARVLDGDGDGVPRGDLGALESCDDGRDADGDLAGDDCDDCPGVANPSQSDADADGLGDACDDGDADGDGVADQGDLCPAAPDPAQADGDGDGLGDACDDLPAGACASPQGPPEPGGLRVRREGSSLRLRWEAAAATSHVHAGALAGLPAGGTRPLACGVPGAEAVVSPPAGNVYLLVGSDDGRRRSRIGASSLGHATWPDEECP